MKTPKSGNQGLLKLVPNSVSGFISEFHLTLQPHQGLAFPEKAMCFQTLVALIMCYPFGACQSS